MIMKTKFFAYGTLVFLFVAGLSYLFSAQWLEKQSQEKWQVIAEAESAFLNALPFSSVFFFDKVNGIALSAITIEKTNDGGKTWTPVRNWDNKGFSSLVFTDNQNGWIVGSEENNKPLVLKTRNKGLDWQDWKKMDFDAKSLGEVNGKFARFYDICFDSAGKSWIVGDGGIVEAVADGQNLKISSIFSTKEILYGISCNDSGEVWAVGENSAVFHYRNGWSRKEIDKKYIFKKVVSTESDVWLLGHNAPPIEENVLGTLLRSRDNGQTWENKTPKSASLLYDLYLKDGKGWLVGAEGSIYYSSDNGNSWTKSKSPTKNDLMKIFFLDSNNGWISGDKATILKYQN
jgi:photosystem II stability/assembly factor-like uncharacterized protein